jgi:hypothetical protein
MGPAGQWMASATNRLCSELALALAISHHMVFGDMRSALSRVGDYLAGWTSRDLVVEFVPFGGSAGNVYKPSMRHQSDEWYKLETLSESLAILFRTVAIVPGAEDARRLIVCREKLVSM